MWLTMVTGLRAEVSWVGYGMVIATMRDRNGAWLSNSSGLNVLLLRWSDLRRDSCPTGADAAEQLFAALRESCAARRGPTLVIMPPDGSLAPSAAKQAEVKDGNADNAENAATSTAATAATVVRAVSVTKAEDAVLTAQLRAIDGLRLVDEAAMQSAMSGLRRYHSPF